MSAGAIAAIIGTVVGLAAVAAGAWLVWRADARARTAEADAAIERSKTLDVQAREMLAEARARAGRMSDDQLLNEVTELASRIRKDQKP